MLKLIAIAMVSTCTTACVSLEAKQYCTNSRAEQCSPSTAKHASIEVLHANGRHLTVMCTVHTRQIIDKDRSDCSRQVASLVSTLNKKWTRELQQIQMSDVTFKEISGEVEVYKNGGKYPFALMPTYQISAVIPLLWKD